MTLPRWKSLSMILTLITISIFSVGYAFQEKSKEGGTPSPSQFFYKLPEAILDTPGCLGIRQAATPDGMQLLFA